MNKRKLLELCEHLGVDYNDLKDEERSELLKCGSRQAEEQLRLKTVFIRSRVAKRIKSILNTPLQNIRSEDITFMCNKGGRGDLKQLIESWRESQISLSQAYEELRGDMVDICEITIKALNEKVIDVRDLHKTCSMIGKHLPDDKTDAIKE